MMINLFIDRLIETDTQTLLLLNGLHSEFWDSFMFIATGKYIWIPMYVVLAAALFATQRMRVAAIMLLFLVTGIILCDAGINHIIRPLLARLRPAHPDSPISNLVHIVNDYRGGMFGFPSCHAANSFCLAIFLCMVARSRLFVCMIIIWAIIHSYTRLYLGVHYPGDLMAGAFVGSAVGFVMWWLSEKVLSRTVCPEPRFSSELSGELSLRTFMRNPWSWPVIVELLTFIVIAYMAFNGTLWS